MHLNSVNIYILPHVGGEEIGKFEEESSALSDWVNETIVGQVMGMMFRKGRGKGRWALVVV